MENQKLFKQAVDFQRNAFNNSFQAIVQFQDQAERVANTILGQVNLVPEEGRQFIGQWVDGFKKGRDNYRDTVQEGFNQLERVFGVTH